MREVPKNQIGMQISTIRAGQKTKKDHGENLRTGESLQPLQKRSLVHAPIELRKRARSAIKQIDSQFQS
jgi:hypothetical protein